MRTTKKELTALLGQLSKATGVDLMLDHNSTYGGWKLERSSGRFGGVDHFGPSRRVSAGEMAFAMRLALEAVEARNHLHTWERRTESGRTDEVWMECRCGAVSSCGEGS